MAAPPVPIGWTWTGLSIGLFLSFLDSSIVVTSLFHIGTEFGDLERLNWVTLAYTLSYLGCAVFLARISDVIGRRDAFFICYILFIAFSIGCGFAHSLQQLIVFRAVQGMGGSGLYSIPMIVFPEIAPPRLLQGLAALIDIIITLASVLGPVLGEVLTRHASWRWIFWINGPIGGTSFLIVLVMWPKPQYLTHLERRSWMEVDYVGSSLLIAATVLIVFPFQNAGATADQRGEAIFLTPFIVGSIAFIGVLACAIGSAIPAKVNGEKDRSCETLVIATCSMILGCGLLMTASGSTSLEPKTFGYLVFVGLGFGLSVLTATIIAASQSPIGDHAPAQGIVAQVRVFGGSLGIVASSAISGASLRTEFGRPMTSQQVFSIESSGANLTPSELAAIRRAYANASREDMRVCTIVFGIALMWALGTWNRKRLTHIERAEQQAREDVERKGAART
ncbi:major facilitator superfamily transporter [Xylaria sp. CBS 124048]|nr:major facilitator superfamily transporter [Xylaria sp. CBS 124048]